MSAKVRIFLLAMTAVLAVGSVITLVLLLQNEGFGSVETFSDESRVVIHETETVPRKKMTAVAEDGGRLYVYYQDRGLVNVYTDSGVFLYGVQICTSQNGAGQMAVIDGLLYVESKAASIYIFEGKRLLRSVIFSYDEFIAGNNEFNETSALISDANSKDTGPKRFSISNDGWTLYVKNDSGELTRASFLPERNRLITDLAVLSCLFVAAFCELFRRTDFKEGKP